MRKTLFIVALLGVAVAATGCSNKKLIAQKDQQIASLQEELGMTEAELAAEKERVAELNNELTHALNDQRAKEQVWMREREGLMQITLDGEVTFASGSRRLTAEGKDILNRIWDVLANYPERTILIEGHTDNVPIAPQFQDRFKSNWELSSARAHSVLHYVRSKYNVDPSRIAAVGYGEYRPMASNDTPEGRAQNRRVVITVGPPKTMRTMP